MNNEEHQRLRDACVGDDPAPWFILADWLDDHHQPSLATAVRNEIEERLTAPGYVFGERVVCNGRHGTITEACRMWINEDLDAEGRKYVNRLPLKHDVRYRIDFDNSEEELKRIEDAKPHLLVIPKDRGWHWGQFLNLAK